MVSARLKDFKSFKSAAEHRQIFLPSFEKATRDFSRPSWGLLLIQTRRDSVQNLTDVLETFHSLTHQISTSSFLKPSPVRLEISPNPSLTCLKVVRLQEPPRSF